MLGEISQERQTLYDLPQVESTNKYIHKQTITKLITKSSGIINIPVFERECMW